jgi:hypothetical protein
VDGVDFYAGDRELDHIHLDGEIHLRTTRTLGAMLIEDGLADAFKWHDAWVQYPIRKQAVERDNLDENLDAVRCEGDGR